MRTGQAHGCRQSLNGSALHWIIRWKEILSRTRIFIRAHCPPQEMMDACTRCLATFGNGPAAPTRPTPVIAPYRAHLANTTASLCATSTFCVAVRVQRHVLIFAALIAISSNQKNAGGVRGSDWRAIHNKSSGLDPQARAERYCHNDRRPANGHATRSYGSPGNSWFTLGCNHRSFFRTTHPALQVFL